MLILFILFAVLGYERVGGFEGIIRSTPPERWNPFNFGG